MTPKEALEKLRALANDATMVRESPTRKRAISAQERAEFTEACDVLDAEIKPVEGFACGGVLREIDAFSLDYDNLDKPVLDTIMSEHVERNRDMPEQVNEADAKEPKKVKRS